MQLLGRRDLQNNNRITTQEDQSCCIKKTINLFGEMFNRRCNPKVV